MKGESRESRIRNRGLNDYGEVPLEYEDYLALLAVVEAAQEFRAEHPAWSPDEFDEVSIGEALRGDDSPGARLDAALAALTTAQKPEKP